MLSLPKLAVISLVVIAIGALQFALPSFTGKRSEAAFSQAIGSPNKQQKSKVTNQPVTDYQNAQSGTLYFIHDQLQQGETVQKHLLSPVLKTKVDIKVTGIVARTTLTQTFKNSGEHWVNGLYVFPLPENAAVDHLLMKVGERKIEGKIQEKSVAQKTYLQAKAQGKKASMVAQLRPNMFSNSIANIAPGETIEVTIEYQQALRFQQQQYSLRFPMSITPRYLPSASSETLPTQLTHSEPSLQQPNIHVELQVSLHPGFEIQDIKSEFHPINTKLLPNGSHLIQMSKGNIVNQDFVLNWRPKLGTQPQTAHFTQQVNGDEFGLIMLLPATEDAKAIQTQPREVIFVLDTSGSMEGDPLAQAKQALLLAVNQLKDEDTFNIIQFNSYAQNLWKSPKRANITNKEDANHFVEGLSANGGTEMESALNVALTQPEMNNPRLLRQIVFITDGSVGNEETLMQLISSNLKNSRLFTVGIGSAPNSYFMSEAAKMGRGTFTYIGSVAQVQEKMFSLLTKLQNPVLTDIELQLNPSSLTPNLHLEFYPNVISDLYKDEPLVLSYKLTEDKAQSVNTNNSNSIFSNIRLKAQYQGKPWMDSLRLSAKTRQSGLNVLWAREKIGQLTRDKRSASMRIDGTESEQVEYKTLITETALTHHLVSQYTTLLAVDVTPSRLLQSMIANQKVTKSLPRGTTNQQMQPQGSFPQTATSAQLKIIIGLILIGIMVCMYLLTTIKTTCIDNYYY